MDAKMTAILEIIENIKNGSHFFSYLNMSAFGVGEKGNGGPDKAESYKLNQTKAFMEEKDA